MDVSENTAGLEERLRRYPAQRYPVQHATLRFHLGVALTNAERYDDARRCLAQAVALFAPMPVEQAKVRNALGAALRLAGRLEEASGEFTEAARAFAREGLEVERGAALFNLALVQRELGDHAQAVAALEQSRLLLDPAAVPAQAAAAARELGTTLLECGQPERACPTLAEAVQLADRAGDLAGLGAAANVLGLAQLAANRPEDAGAAFRSSVGAHPRSLRPGSHAMAQANLALAHERCGVAPLARYAARQALAISGAPPVVRQQAAEVLRRLGDPPGDLARVLELQPEGDWPAAVRPELARWAETSAAQRDLEARCWLEALLANPPAAAEMTQVWLGALLELPLEAVTALVSSMVGALPGRAEEDQRRFRSLVGRALPCFHPPQWARLEAVFDSAAATAGQAEGWG